MTPKQISRVGDCSSGRRTGWGCGTKQALALGVRRSDPVQRVLTREAATWERFSRSSKATASTPPKRRSRGSRAASSGRTPNRAAHSSEQAELLERGGFELDRLEFGLEDPIARTAFEYAVLRATGLTTHQAAKRLGVNDSRVRQRLAERALYGIKAGEEWRLPAFQFALVGLVPGIERVLPQLPKSLNPVAVHRWFHTPNPDLEEREARGRTLTPLQWLPTGNDPDIVAELAAGL